MLVRCVNRARQEHMLKTHKEEVWNKYCSHTLLVHTYYILEMVNKENFHVTGGRARSPAG